MKNTISLLAALALLCVMSACFPEPEFAPEPKEEAKEEAPEKFYYTMRLVKDDNDTIGISVGGGDYGKQPTRALTNDMAQAFHDFFEVVFFHPGPPVRVARTTWNVGETPELRGVYGNGETHSPVDYRAVSTANGTAPAAVLFAGSKADKTLLAVGHLALVDNQPANDTTNRVGPDTTVVTFEVTSLRAGASFATANISPGPGGNPPNTSSFFTNFNGGGTPSATSTIVSQQTGAQSIFIHYVDKKRFPLYRLNHGGTTTASYTFYIVTPSGYSGPLLPAYVSGFVRVGHNFEVRNPRYILADGYYQYSSIFPQAVTQGTTLATMTNNAGASFENPVNFTFNTTDSPDGSIFAITFEIFVNNLTWALTTTPGAVELDPVRWRISTGVGTKWLDLDDGLGGEGGAILLGSGTGSILTDRLDPYDWQ